MCAVLQYLIGYQEAASDLKQANLPDVFLQSSKSKHCIHSFK